MNNGTANICVTDKETLVGVELSDGRTETLTFSANDLETILALIECKYPGVEVRVDPFCNVPTRPNSKYEDMEKYCF